RVIKKFMYVTGENSLSDVIPFPPLRWVVSLGMLTKVKRIMKELDSIVESRIAEHVHRELYVKYGNLEGARNLLDEMAE
ncbi:Exocyst complex component 3, partial [Sarracenia purpurea var. burkii]